MSSPRRLIVSGVLFLLCVFVFAGDHQGSYAAGTHKNLSLSPKIWLGAACPAVQNTPYFTIAYGLLTLDSNPAPVGSIVTAHSPRGDVVGCYIVTAQGNYGAMYIYGEDIYVSPPIPGMRLEETVTFEINGSTAQATPNLTWIDDKSFHAVALSGTTPSVDLSITKADSTDPVTAGEILTYTLTVMNTGPSSATDVSVVDTLPSGVALVSCDSSQGNCTSSVPMTCDLDSLTPLASAIITLTVDVDPSTRGILSNAASVAATEPDSASGNNSATETTTVSAEANLTIAKTSYPNTVTAGELLTYTLMITNSGPSTATGVGVTDNLPIGVTLDNAASSQGNCTGMSTIACDLDTLVPQTTATITVVVSVDQNTQGVVTNTAIVNGNETDPSTVDNTSSVTTTILPKYLIYLPLILRNP